MEFKPYEADVHLIVVVFAEFFHRLLDAVVVSGFEIVVYLLFLIGIDHFFDEVVNIDFGAGEDNSFEFVHHLFHRHTVGLSEVVQIDTSVDSLDDLFLTGRFLGDRTDPHVVGTNDLVLFDIFLDDAQELIAVAFGFRHAYARDEQ